MVTQQVVSNAFIAPECPNGPCPEGVMLSSFTEALSSAEIDAIVEYMLALDGESQPSQAAPAPQPEEAASSDTQSSEVELGKTIVAAFNKGGCAGCHVIPGVPGASGQIGPDLSEIGLNASSRISGYSATEYEYIHESIVNPSAFIAPAYPSGQCPENVMLSTFAETLTSQELDTIVGYLASLWTESAVVLADVLQVQTALDASLPAESILDPFMPLPKEPASDAKIALGKYLFFDSRLSGNNSRSCASCHMPENAYTDGLAFSQGYPSTKYFRNTPTLFNTVFAERLYRDGRMDGDDMLTLVRDHIAEAHFLHVDGRSLNGRTD